jgi:hypothetical protein
MKQAGMETAALTLLRTIQRKVLAVVVVVSIAYGFT